MVSYLGNLFLNLAHLLYLCPIYRYKGMGGFSFNLLDLVYQVLVQYQKIQSSIILSFTPGGHTSKSDAMFYALYILLLGPYFHTSSMQLNFYRKIDQQWSFQTSKDPISVRFVLFTYTTFFLSNLIGFGASRNSL